MKNPALTFATSILAAMSFTTLVHARPEPTLKVGSPAPKLPIYKLVKGTPMNGFQPGKVYVVEFWATWCGPCRESIPHLTELAKKFKGKATFIGVDSFEQAQQEPGNKKTTYIADIKKFVTQMGAKMTYNVVADDPSGHLGKSWMDAAGQDGIPTAFVVDQHSKIAWIGHPMMGLDTVVAQVIKGTYKPSPATTPAASEDPSNQPKELKDLTAAVEGKDSKDIVAKADIVLAKYPMLEKSEVSEIRLEALAKYDVPAAIADGKRLAAGAFKDLPGALNNMVWFFVDPEHPVPGADLAWAEATVRRAIGLLEKTDELHAMAMDTLAAALFDEGKREDAITEEKLAIEEGKALGSKLKPDDLADFQKHLVLFQGAKSA